ncbi:MAG TPA: STAS domain-containing protein [Phycisphaerae bacterium]|nr:STAS domain-containing protein [Phycisphaerae bacterium]
MTTIADTYGSMTVLTIEPALAKDDAETFRRTASEQVRAGGRWFVLDLSKATYFDSQGLEDLLWFQEQVEGVGGIAKIAGLKGNGRKIFEMVRFDKRFEIFDTVHKAVRDFH